MKEAGRHLPRSGLCPAGLGRPVEALLRPSAYCPMASLLLSTPIMTPRFSLLAGLPFVGARRLRGTLDFVAMDDHARLRERFLARHIAMDGLASSL